MNDDERESLIDASYDQLINAGTEEGRRKHFKDMCYHVKLRSPEQIMKMETERRISSKYSSLFTYSCEPQCDSDPGYGHSADCKAKQA